MREPDLTVGYASAMERSMGRHKAVTSKLAAAYRRGSRKEKARIRGEPKPRRSRTR